MACALVCVFESTPGFNSESVSKRGAGHSNPLPLTAEVNVAGATAQQAGVLCSYNRGPGSRESLQAVGRDRTKSGVENSQVIDSIKRVKRYKHTIRPTEVHAGYTST